MPNILLAIHVQKPTKFGVKVWVNAEAKTGYILNIQVYTGAVNEPSTKRLAHRVVIDLTEEFQGRGHKIFLTTFTRVHLC